MGKVVFGIMLGALMMHTVPSVVASLSHWDPSGAGSSMARFS